MQPIFGKTVSLLQVAFQFTGVKLAMMFGIDGSLNTSVDAIKAEAQQNGLSTTYYL